MRKSVGKWWLGGFCFAAAILLAATGWCGDGAAQSAATVPTATLEGMIYFVSPEGTVTIISPGLRIGEGPRALVRIDARTRIFRNDSPVTVDRLQSGDAVRTIYVPVTGVAVTIRARGR